MRTKKFSSLIVLITIFISACGTSSNVKVVNFSPSGKVSQLTTFTIEFSENLAPIDKQNQWLSDEFVEFDPKIPGKFKWVAGNILIFSPDQPLQPIQSYTARITSKVIFDSKLSYDFDKYEFQTPEFDVNKTEFFWSHIPNEKYKVSVKANVHFNYAVNPGMLKDYLFVERNGTPVTNFQIVSETSSEIIALYIGDIPQSDKEQKYKVVIKSGLTSIVGKKPLEDTKEFEYELPPITKLVITGVASGFDGQMGWIEVNTTQMVDEKQIKNFVTVMNSKNLKFFVNENSFRIEGDFGGSALVSLKITKGLPGFYGGDLENEFEQDVSFVDLSPSISFTDKKGKYLMLSGERNLLINAVNIPGVDIEVSQVFKNNILFFLSQYSYMYENGGEEYNNLYFYEGDLDKYGKTLYKDYVQLKGGQNWLQKFNVNLDKIYDQTMKGIFIVQAMSNSDRWVSAAKMLSLSDLGIITKKTNNEMIVFINSIATTEPVKGVEINLISSNNQILLTGKTDSEGIIHFKNISENLKGFIPRLITAETEKDFNYIDLLETGIETSRFDVGGSRTSSEGLRAFIYGDRNIYRPGERVNITGIVRDDFTKPVKDIPVFIKIVSPSGKTFDEFKKNLSTEGSFEITFEVPGYSQTGEYRAEVYSGAGNLIGSYYFSIEDFVPDKIRLTLKNDKSTAKPGETIKIGIDAEYLFGAKASGLHFESDIQVRHRQFYSKKYSSYNFGNSTLVNSNIQNAFSEGTLDNDGKGEIVHIIPADLKSSGIATMYAFISVFDPTGRTVNKATSVDVFPEKYFIGIKSHGYYFGTNEKINFSFVAVDKDDRNATDLNATIKLVRFEWQTVLKKDNSGRFYYASEKKDVQEWEKEINLSDGEKSLPVIVTKSGEYEIRISRKGSSHYQYLGFYAYGWASTTASSFEVDKEGRIEVVSDKQTYSPGETAKILFTTPFSGKMLVTFERSGIYDYKYVDVKEKSTQLEIDLKENFIPNIYVTATLFKKQSTDNSAPFLVGHGFLSLKVERKEYKLPVNITAPQKIKPNTKQEITIKTIPEKDVYITLAAVDEGILQIKNYITPDPFGFMYAKRALEVESYDLYKLLLPEILAVKSSTGGDELAKQLQKRTNPVTSKRYNLVALWSGIRKTDSDGIVKVSISIPQFNGEIRLMAVAYSGQRFGSADVNMKVADDLIIEPQIPRFLAPNDSLAMPITIINTTNKNGTVNVNVRTEGPISVVSSKSESVNVPPNSSRQVIFSINANNQIGYGKIIIETSGMAKVKEETNISIRPVSPYINETSSGIIYAGKELTLNIDNNFVDGTKSSEITISKFPAVQFAKVLRGLVGYPHGCIEQTVSKLFPQLYFEDIAKLIAPEYYKTNNPIYYIKEGIKKIESMQQWSGGLSYWPGGTDENWWGSVYAAHFLIEAKKAGFNVSDNLLTKLLSYLSAKSREKITYDYITYTNNSRVITKIANKEVLYSLYVLALAGKGDIATMNYYKSRPNLVSEDCKYLLAGAYALMGKWNNYYEIIPQQFYPETAGRETGGSFDSDIRANAIMLNVLAELEPSNKQIPFIIKYLSKNIDRIYSTQERAFTFIGLGKSARKNSDANVKVDLYSNGNKIGSFNNADVSLPLNNGIKSFTLKAYGSGEVYYFLNTSGVKTGNVQETDSHIELRRKYYDYRTRSEISSNNFYQGQLIVCSISLSSRDVYAKNIAISDLIPSGFEIENPRLSGNSQLQWENSQQLPVQYMDIRDDRLILFTNIDRLGTRNFYYMLRVVNKGKFQLPALSGEAMYDAEIHSINGRGVVRVKQN